MRHKFCPSCGKATEDLYEGLCKECFLRKTVIVEAPKWIDAAQCRICGRIFNGKEWKDYDGIDDAIDDIALANSHIIPHAKASVLFKEPEGDNLRNTTVPASVHAEAEVEGKNVSASVDTEIVFGTRVCDICGKRRGGYYESVIQIRGKKNEEILAFIQKRIGEIVSKDKSSYITKIDAQKEGFDVYVGGMSAARKVSGEAKRIYRLETKRTYTQNGVRNGKEIFRETILLRL